MSPIYGRPIRNLKGNANTFFRIGLHLDGLFAEKIAGDKANGYCQLKSDWAGFLPWAGNLNAEQSMSYEFVYCLKWVST